MKKGNWQILWGLFCLVLSTTSTFGQQGWEVGGMVGGAWYFGDLNTTYRLNKPGPALSLAGRYNFNKRICTKIQLGYSLLGANDADSRYDYEKARNLHFRSHTFDLSGVVEFNFLSYTHGSYEEPFTPYLLMGFGVVRFSPMAKLNNIWYDLREYGTEGQDQGSEYFKITGNWILGMGFKFDINRTTSVNIEGRMNRVFTDYLDDVSTVYPDKTRLQSRRGSVAVELSDPSIFNENYPEIGSGGVQRGNDNDNDVYATIQVGLMYYFGRVRCPAISRPDR